MNRIKKIAALLLACVTMTGAASPAYAYTEKYVDMVKAGIVDPTKVTRSALQNAASIAATVLTTESLVADKKEENPAPAAPAGGMGGMY